MEIKQEGLVSSKLSYFLTGSQSKLMKAPTDKRQL